MHLVFYICFVPTINFHLFTAQKLTNTKGFRRCRKGKHMIKAWNVCLLQPLEIAAQIDITLSKRNLIPK